MRNLLFCAVSSLVALAAGTLCHRFAPGLGLVLMPMFWPLAVLSAKVPAKWYLPTAAIVPFISFALTGMPAFPVIVALKFAALSALVGFVVSRVLSRKNFAGRR